MSPAAGSGTGTVEILILGAAGRRIGIELHEVADITISSFLKDKKEVLIRQAKEVGLLVNLAAVLDGTGGADGNFSGETGEEEAFLSVRRGGNANLLVTASQVETVVQAPLAAILPLPPYVMQIQQPLFVWGVYQDGDSQLLLITFSYWGAGKVKGDSHG